MPGKPKYRYPGWGIEQEWYDYDGSGHEDYPAAIYQNLGGSFSDMICVREVAMMLAMDRLFDKPDWHIHVFDDDIAAKWRDEIMAWPDVDLWNRIAHFTPEWLDSLRDDEHGNPSSHRPIPCPEDILNDEAADYCILELREKAKHFKLAGFVPTLDATFIVAKSDVLVPGNLREALREAFAKLKTDQAARPDRHPNANETVHDLVDPSMYPLVFGRSLFFEDEPVGVDDAFDRWIGKGDVIPRQFYKLTEDEQCSKEYLSDKYQWLPANLEFTAGGGVKFTSYINNLHPTKYRDIYATIEKLVEISLPLWDKCVFRARYPQPGRQGPRLHPKNAYEWDPPSWLDMLARWEQSSGFLMGDPPQTPDEVLEEREHIMDVLKQVPRSQETLREIEAEWSRIRKLAQIKPPVFEPEAEDSAYRSKPLRLASKFKDSGLQIIVKMTSIELTPEKPELPPGGWRVEGQMNENIVATALYYVDSENITESYIDFRTQTYPAQDELMEDTVQSLHWMESIYGVKLGRPSGSSSLQTYGSVVTAKGRLLAFPNVFHQRASGFKLADPSKPGHCRFISLFLVSPAIRIINTGNVPPQQGGWWDESTFGTLRGEGGTGDLGSLARIPPEIAVLLLKRGFGKGHLDAALEKGVLGPFKLPNELLGMVENELGGWFLMGRGEAEEHRIELTNERSAFQKRANDHWHECHYTENDRD